MANPIRILGAVALLFLDAGCATPEPSPNLLSAAGFKTTTASTAKQQASLRKLRAGKVTASKQPGKTYYVYPDRANNQVYVGTAIQYQAYLQLRLAKQLSLEKIEAVERNEDAARNWEAWGPGWGWVW